MAKKADNRFYLNIRHADPKTGQTVSERIPVSVVRSKRKTIGITVDEQAQVTLRIPLRADAGEAAAFAQEKSGWILSKVLLQRQRMEQCRQKEQEMRSRFTPAQEAALRKRYIEAAHTYFPQRCSHYADILGVTYGGIRIAEQKTRWGSCSQSGTLSFHWKLMLAPPRVLDYVVVHELCHLIEMNHSPSFWALVESVMPEYKEYKKWLRENGDTLRLS